MNNNILFMHIPSNNNDIMETPILNAGRYSIMIKNIDKENVLDHFSVIIGDNHCYEEWDKNKLIFFIDDVSIKENEVKEIEIYLPKGSYNISVRGYDKENKDVANVILYSITAYCHTGKEKVEHSFDTQTDMFDYLKDFYW